MHLVRHLVSVTHNIIDIPYFQYRFINFATQVSHQGHQMHPQLCRPGVQRICISGLQRCLIRCTDNDDAPGESHSQQC